MRATKKEAFRKAIREAVGKADAEVKRTGKEVTISTGISFTFPPKTPSQDYLVILSPGETWQTIWLVTDAPSASEAEQMVWTERGYHSGEPVRFRLVTDRAASTHTATYVTKYDAARVEASREMVRYND